MRGHAIAARTMLTVIGNAVGRRRIQNRKTQRKVQSMGVSVREKPKASGYWWLFIRHKGQRVCQYVSQDKEIADDAAKDIEREIRTGKFDLAALKAARTAAAKESVCPTLSKYFETFE